MQVLALSRASVAAEGVDDAELDERHWTYMDRYAETMTARGPLLDIELVTWRGSMHVLDLPSAAEARAFVEEEPYHLAQLFASHRLWRYDDLLGRTMWQYAGEPGQPRFLALCGARPELPEEAAIVHGALSDLETGALDGYLIALQAPSAAAARAWLASARPVEVYGWEFGGRR